MSLDEKATNGARTPKGKLKVGAQPALPPPAPILRGHLKLEDNDLVWEGFWAMSADDFVSGLKSPFRYQRVQNNNGPDQASSRSGLYSGYFIMKLVTGELKIEENNVELTFEADGGTYKVSGGGVNIYGAFQVTGTFDPSSDSIESQKIYAPVVVPTPKAKTPKPKTPSKPAEPKPVAEVDDGLERSARKKKIPSYLAEPGSSSPSPALSSALKACADIVRKLMADKYAEPFNRPVDPVALNIPDYFEKISNPMDFSTVLDNLTKNFYQSPAAFAQDMRLIFTNCLTYNPKGTAIVDFANSLSKTFERMFKELHRQFKPPESRTGFSPEIHVEFQPQVSSAKKPRISRPSEIYGKISRKKPPPAAVPFENNMVRELMAKVEALQAQVVTLSDIKKAGSMRDDSRPLSFEEKQTLSKGINKLPADKVAKVIQILKDCGEPMVQEDQEEVEIDIEAMRPSSLRKLQKYVRTCLLGKRAKTTVPKVKKLLEEATKSKATTDRMIEMARAGKASRVPGDLSDESSIVGSGLFRPATKKRKLSVEEEIDVGGHEAEKLRGDLTDSDSQDSDSEGDVVNADGDDSDAGKSNDDDQGSGWSNLKNAWSTLEEEESKPPSPAPTPAANSVSSNLWADVKAQESQRQQREGNRRELEQKFRAQQEEAERQRRAQLERELATKRSNEEAAARALEQEKLTQAQLREEQRALEKAERLKLHQSGGIHTDEFNFSFR